MNNNLIQYTANFTLLKSDVDYKRKFEDEVMKDS